MVERGDGEETEHAVAEMVDRKIGNHPFQIGLCPRGERREDDRANRQPKQPRTEDFDFVWEERQQQAHETVNAHLRKHTRKHHRDADRRGFICIGQPGVKWKERHFHREAEKDSGKGEPREIAGEQSSFSEIGERGKVERAFREINSEKRQQHRDAAEKCVNEKFRRGAVAIFAAPDFDEQKRRDQAHLVKQKPENEILRGERAVERRLHQQHQRAETAARCVARETRTER